MYVGGFGEVFDVVEFDVKDFGNFVVCDVGGVLECDEVFVDIDWFGVFL